MKPDGKTIILRNNHRTELPSIQVEFYWEIFTKKESMELDDLFTMLYWFLCQVGSTVLISSDPYKLVKQAEVLRTIIFPFEYDDSYMPVISEQNFGYLSAPFPVLIGVVKTSEHNIEEIEMSASDKSLFVFLDEKKLMVKFGTDEILPIKDFMKEFDDDGNSFEGKHFPVKNIKELKKNIIKNIK